MENYIIDTSEAGYCVTRFVPVSYLFARDFSALESAKAEAEDELTKQLAAMPDKQFHRWAACEYDVAKDGWNVRAAAVELKSPKETP